jgi:hypothetical protein
MRTVNVILILSTLFLGACKSELTPKAYVEWIRQPSNGLVTEKQVGDYKFSLQYKPIEYMALQESKGDNLGKGDFEKVKKTYDGVEYYDLKISVKGSDKDMLMHGVQNTNEYFTRAHYMSFQMQKQLSMIAGKDTLPCTIFHFERNYNASPDSHCSLGFDVPKENEANRKIIYNDEILGLNQVEIELNGKSFSKIPQLKYPQ